VDEEGLLFEWIRHYASLILLLLVLGTVLAFTYVKVFPPKSEAWTIIVEPPNANITPRQLGPVVQAVFRSEAVYLPVMRELRVRESPTSFLKGSVDLLPIPDSRFFIVVGRSPDARRAARISDAMARSLLKVFKDRGISQFSMFDRPQPATVRRGLPPPVAAALGGAIGLWLGLALSLIHFLVLRPVLSFRRALALVGANGGAILLGRPSPWLGVLRPRARWWDTVPNRIKLSALSSAGRPPRLVAPGESRRWEAVLSRRFLQAVSHQTQLDITFRGAIDATSRRASSSTGNSAADGTVFVCSASTRERDVYLAKMDLPSIPSEGPERPQLVWIS
jgi:hypothetical protein